MTKDVRIKIFSELYEVEASLFDESTPEDVEADGEEFSVEPEIMEINSLGSMTDDGERVSISYEESEATGMSGSTTTLSYMHSSPEVVTMTRTGMVSATLVFEESKRHHCIYKTPFMPFEVCVHTTKVINKLPEDNTLDLDYIVEIRGAKAERTKFKMQIL